ncbi:zinc-dependent alcohol dehydrogenase family protein [Psychromonas sp. 14N.309.X.WAT.B.A12]|uniref:zinc-dependent alcohol dehydrogenase family protein n=1 Tax=Psychromonas sp. 14N.309.X.WAT.B.A12 TaxID=2998322 RepID=UPI0025B2049D|nr:zinc-dependent alcohol dehydrogenase family protein [Psychromonas sp. 14N.309.X.WAT.B.A12]MDN2662160.1 zinc-dependent alcohol dehydrogenase family protein [Psychromonas sp. 14N.309.X.WAT.B.A12]
MKAMILNSYGEQAVFEQAEIAKPTVKAGHVVLKVSASSVNTVDTMIKTMGETLAGLSPALPALLGMDFAGTITEIGEDVENYKVGDEVYGCAGGLANLPGALAEYMLADANLIALKPKNLSMREAAALPLVAITAYEGLQRAHISAGKKVLVHGGSGGVGHVAVQLAKYFGSDVYSTGGGDKQIALIEKLGATGIDYKSEKVADYVEKHTDAKGFDIIFDSVGGDNLSNSFEAAAINGQIATTTSMLSLDLLPAHMKGLSLHVVFMLIPMLHNTKREEHGIILANLTNIVEAGGLTPVLDENHYSFEQVGDAYARLTSGQGMGKVVVEI